MRESLKVTEDIGETSAENTVDLGPVDESTQTELTSSGIKDIKDYAQFYRDSTWSNYKHHNTVKILFGITPQGTVWYVSEAWCGGGVG